MRQRGPSSCRRSRKATLAGASGQWGRGENGLTGASLAGTCGPLEVSRGGVRPVGRRGGRGWNSWLGGLIRLRPELAAVVKWRCRKMGRSIDNLVPPATNDFRAAAPAEPARARRLPRPVTLDLHPLAADALPCLKPAPARLPDLTLDVTPSGSSVLDDRDVRGRSSSSKAAARRSRPKRPASCGGGCGRRPGSCFWPLGCSSSIG